MTDWQAEATNWMRRASDLEGVIRQALTELPVPGYYGPRSIWNRMVEAIEEPIASLHIYQSTACLHELHEQCRKTCKFCYEACRCSCHAEEVSPDARRELVEDVLTSVLAGDLKLQQAVEAILEGS